MTTLHEIRVNGDVFSVEQGTTVLALVGRFGRDPRTVAVELNGRILPRDRFGETVLDGGDRVEIVHFVQGG